MCSPEISSGSLYQPQMSGHMYFFGIHNQQLSVFQLYAAENRILYFLSFLCIPFYFRRAGGPHISTLFYTCNMQKRENKAIFLRISGEMAKNKGICSRQQNATGVCRASLLASTTARLAAWTALQNYVLLFSQPCRQYSYAKHSAAAGKLTSCVSRQQSFVNRHPFYRANLILSSVNNLLPGSPGQYPHVILFFYTRKLILPSSNRFHSGSSGQALPGLSSFHTRPSTFHQPVHNNSRQVKPAGCQYPPLFTSFLLSFCECFSFF